MNLHLLLKGVWVFHEYVSANGGQSGQVVKVIQVVSRRIQPLLSLSLESIPQGFR